MAFWLNVKKMKTRAHVIVGGKVQGVFFRATTKGKADSLNVTGYVRNLPDQRVEAVFEGDEEAVKMLIEFCRHGPRGAMVTDVELTWGSPTDEFSEFEIRY
jgi:acylphosphatase